jgi:hypothetical protein
MDPLEFPLFVPVFYLIPDLGEVVILRRKKVTCNGTDIF